jgi:hypothetical protein
METMNQIREAESTKKEEAYSIYVDLVRSIARNHRQDPAKAESILSSVGKSSDDLEKDLEKERKRIELLEILKGKDPAEREHKQAKQDLEALHQEYEKAVRPILNKIENCRAIVSHAQAKLESFQHVSIELENNYWNEIVNRKIEKLSKKMSEFAGDYQTVQLERDRLIKRNLQHTEEFKWVDLRFNNLNKHLGELREEFARLLELRRAHN